MSLLSKTKLKDFFEKLRLIAPYPIGDIFLYKYNAEWDKKLNELMDKFSFDDNTYGGSATVAIGGQSVWVANYPYAYASPWTGSTTIRIRPSIKTIIRVKNKLEEDKQNWGKIVKYTPTVGLSAAIQKARQKARDNQSVHHGLLKSKIDVLANVEPVKIQKPIPDYTKALTGWRGWRVINHRLSPLGGSDVKSWVPKKIIPSTCICRKATSIPTVATVANPSGAMLEPLHYEPSPLSSCTCGYWSFHTLDNLKQALGEYSEIVNVVGTVDVWGKVIDCENGYRSEFAYPQELWLLDSGYEFLGPLYGVPVRK